jgi:hypothetical protein
MTRRRLLSLAGTVLAARPALTPAAAQEVVPVDFAMLARRRATEAARRLAAEGWRIRDKVFLQRLVSGQLLRTPVHLLRGVQYLFVATARPIECRFSLQLIASTGWPLAESLPDNESGLAALWHEPTGSARCLLELTVPNEAAAGDLAALYVYR